jgi:anti-anti-sigma factor
MSQVDIPGGDTASAVLQVISEQTTVTTLSGEHDITTRHMLVEALVRAGERPNVIVDLTSCDFLDSSILGILFSAHNDHQPGGRFELVLPERENGVNRAIELTGVRDVMIVHAALGDALRSVGEA